MSNVIRRILCLLMCCMVFLMTSCGGKDNTSDLPNIEDGEDKLVLSGAKFYRLEKNQIDTAYQMGTNGKIKRVDYALNKPVIGQARVLFTVNNLLDYEFIVKIKLTTTSAGVISNEQKEFTIVENEQKSIFLDFEIKSLDDVFIAEMLDSQNQVIKGPYSLTQGPEKLDFEKVSNFSRNNPAYQLTWSQVSDATGYQIYLENEVIQTCQGNTATIGLKPYTAYQIEVRAIFSDQSQSVASPIIYLVTEDTEESQDKRMKEWQDNRFGMFIHWGGYAALGGKFVGTNVSNVTYTEKNPYLALGGSNGTYSEWIQFGAQIPNDTYRQEVESKFTAENFSASEWVSIAKKAGMKYIILTTKHHEGLSLFPSTAENAWTIDYLNQRNFVKELVEAGAKAGIRIGAYYSQALDWSQEGGIGWTPQRSANFHAKEQLRKDVLNQGFTEAQWNDSQYDLYGNPEYKDITEYNKLAVQQVQELLDIEITHDDKKYGIDTLWWDMGNAEYPECNYNVMKAVLAADTDKRIILNNRMLHTDSYSTMPFDFVTPEQSVPSTPQNKYWETCMTMNDNWGYAAHDENWKSSETLIKKLIQITSMGGNFLLNVGPDAKGEIPVASERLLSEVSEWTKINGEAIYGSKKSPFKAKLPWGFASQNGNKLYLHVEDFNQSGELIIPGLKSAPSKAYVIKGNNTYSENLVIKESLEYQGFVLKGEPLRIKTHQVSTTIVLEFADEIIETIANPPKLPISQNEDSPNLVVDALEAIKVGNGPLIFEDGFGASHWDDAKDYLKWQIDFKVVGTYKVKVTYATGAVGGTFLPVLYKNEQVVDSGEIAYRKTHANEGWVTFISSEEVLFNIQNKGVHQLELKRLSTGDSVSIKNIEFIYLKD